MNRILCYDAKGNVLFFNDNEYVDYLKESKAHKLLVKYDMNDTDELAKIIFEFDFLRINILEDYYNLNGDFKKLFGSVKAFYENSLDNLTKFNIQFRFIYKKFLKSNKRRKAKENG